MILLEAADARVLIDEENGARIARLVIRDLDLLRERRSNPTQWGSYPMAPFAGRVRAGRFQHDGVDHDLPLRMPPHAIHGTVLDRVWQHEGGGDFSISLGPDWPFAGRAVQRIELDAGRLRMRLEVHATVGSFPASLGWHPWFRRSLARGNDVRLDFDAEQMLVRGEDQLPSGAVGPPTPPPWDDCFTGVRLPIRLEWPDALAIELRSSASHWVVYDEPEDAICVEPLTAPPNALNDAPRIVDPEHPLVSHFEITW